MKYSDGFKMEDRFLYVSFSFFIKKSIKRKFKMIFHKNNQVKKSFNKFKNFEKVSFKTEFYSTDFYSLFHPSNYIDLKHLGYSKEMSIQNLLNMEFILEINKEFNYYKKMIENK